MRSMVLAMSAVGLCGLAACDDFADVDRFDDPNREREVVGGELIDLVDGRMQGLVEVTRVRDTLRVRTEAAGFVPNERVVLGIHGFDDLSVCPGLEADVDGDGLLSIAEFEAFAGERLFIVGRDVEVNGAGDLQDRWDLVLDPELHRLLGDLDQRVVMIGDEISAPRGLALACVELNTLEPTGIDAEPDETIRSVPIDSIRDGVPSSYYNERPNSIEPRTSTR